MACKPKCQAWAGDATKIHAHARNKPIRAGASHFCKPKTSLSTCDYAVTNLDVLDRYCVSSGNSRWVITEPTDTILEAKTACAAADIRVVGYGHRRFDRPRLVQEVTVLAARISQEAVAHAADDGSPWLKERERRCITGYTLGIKAT
ncbi:hypothetical protein C8J57DRAFT_1239935 [Mycena rebaudengoi]|nr:hypothetical protein C8J57DRAFT_1239935 [Mycena rebaudengoi]